MIPQQDSDMFNLSRIFGWFTADNTPSAPPAQSFVLNGGNVEQTVTVNVHNGTASAPAQAQHQAQTIATHLPAQSPAHVPAQQHTEYHHSQNRSANDSYERASERQGLLDSAHLRRMQRLGRIPRSSLRRRRNRATPHGLHARTRTHSRASSPEPSDALSDASNDSDVAIYAGSSRESSPAPFEPAPPIRGIVRAAFQHVFNGARPADPEEQETRHPAGIVTPNVVARSSSIIRPARTSLPARRDGNTTHRVNQGRTTVSGTSTLKRKRTRASENRPDGYDGDYSDSDSELEADARQPVRRRLSFESSAPLASSSRVPMASTSRGDTSTTPSTRKTKRSRASTEACSSHSATCETSDEDSPRPAKRTRSSSSESNTAPTGSRQDERPAHTPARPRPFRARSRQPSVGRISRRQTFIDNSSPSSSSTSSSDPSASTSLSDSSLTSASSEPENISCEGLEEKGTAPTVAEEKKVDDAV